MNLTTGHAVARDVLRMIAPFDNSAIDLRFKDLTKPEDWLYPKKALFLIRDNHYSTIEVILDSVQGDGMFPLSSIFCSKMVIETSLPYRSSSSTTPKPAEIHLLSLPKIIY